MKEYSDIIGSIGVALLLVAFFLNLFNILSQKSLGYSLLNIFGAGIAGYASLLIGFIPFVVLEVVWCLVAVAGLVKSRSGAEATH